LVTIVALPNHSYGNSELTFEGALIGLDGKNKVQIGDMILDEFQFASIAGTQDVGEPGDGAASSGIFGEQYRWPNAELPYTFSSQIDNRLQGVIKNAISDFNNKMDGCIKIRPKTSQDKDWVDIIKDGGCWSYIGRRQTGRQEISLSTGCHTQRTIQHEFIHALGFYHEQSRPDRDQHVKINWKNIQDEEYGQFIRQETSLTFDVPYDGRSVMHYTPTAFNKARGLNSIESKMPDVATSELGGKVMTENDILKLKRMYRCEDKTVSCGRHTATSCQGCPQGNGRGWCNGDCTWNARQNVCVSKVSEDTCKTVSGPSANQPCVFPFKWNGKTYNNCPVDSDDTNETWCSTKTDSNGNHITGQGLWGHCGSKCKKEGLKNGDKDCWNGCNKKEGKCNWCGPDGWCCRKNWVGNGCDGSVGGSSNHLCVLQ